MPLKQKRRKIQFEIHLVEHCNLNCKACDNFACIAEPEFVSVDKFNRDFERLGKIFSHECEYIYLLGGEPLCPENRRAVYDLVNICRKVYPQMKIYIWTGYTIEELFEENDDIINMILKHTDCIIDGRYEEDKRDITLPLRGSSNQKVIYLHEKNN